jgi:hypothetical protein
MFAILQLLMTLVANLFRPQRRLQVESQQDRNPYGSEPLTDSRPSVMLRTIGKGNGMQLTQLRRREFISLLAAQ